MSPFFSCLVMGKIVSARHMKIIPTSKASNFGFCNQPVNITLMSFLAVNLVLFRKPIRTLSSEDYYFLFCLAVNRLFFTLVVA